MRQLNNLNLVINNDLVAYKGNTIKLKRGTGEKKVRNAVIGGNQGVPISSSDLTTRKGMIVFSLPTTIESAALVEGWASNDGRNVVQLIDAEGSNYSETLTGATLINEPEFNYNDDGSVEIEFEGSQII